MPELAERGRLYEAKGEVGEERERLLEELGFWVCLEVEVVAVMVVLVAEELELEERGS